MQHATVKLKHTYIRTYAFIHPDLRTNWLEHRLYYTMADVDLC